MSGIFELLNYCAYSNIMGEKTVKKRQFKYKLQSFFYDN